MSIDYKSYQLIKANVFQNSILNLIFYMRMIQILTSEYKKKSKSNKILMQ